MLLIGLAYTLHYHQLVGVCFQYGTGVEKDEEEAVKYYKIAADQGYVSAQNNLGETWIRV